MRKRCTFFLHSGKSMTVTATGRMVTFLLSWRERAGRNHLGHRWTRCLTPIVEREGRLTMWGRQKSPWSPACCSDLCRPPIAAPLEVLHSHRKKQSQAKKVQTSSHGRKKSKEERHTQNQVGPAGDGMVRGSMLLASADASLPTGDPDKRHSSNSPTIVPVPNRDE